MVYNYVDNYLSVIPSSANVWMDQLKKSLLNVKIYTHSISSLKRYWECDCKNYSCSSTRSNVAKCIGDVAIINNSALAHIVV